jgi:4,5-dihydroxyphthalate decarboxylase
MKGRLRLSIAISDYDHVRDLLQGEVDADGIELHALQMPVEEIFYRFIHYREWDISEMSFAKYVAMTSAGTDIVAIPVFPSRMFRISSVYVRSDSPLTKPEELAGKRVGLPEWAQTAAVYTRGWLSETVGVPLSSINWFQAGVNQPGRSEKVGIRLPPEVSCTPVPDKSLTQMLLSGEVDAVFSAHPPAPFEENSGEIRQLCPDHREREEAYYRATGIFPIMHVIAIRRAVLDAHPWVAGNLYKGFLAARERSLARLHELTASRFPLPWAAARAAEAEALFGELFPYGIEPNRVTLEAFLRFTHDQGLTDRLLSVDDLFPASVRSSFRI